MDNGSATPRRLSAKTVAPLVVLVAAAVGTWALIQARSPVETTEQESPAPLVRAMTVHLADLPQTVSSQGTVAPRTETTLVVQVGGQIVRVAESFAAGGSFAAGDLLLEIDRRDYQLAVTRAEALVSQARLRRTREEAEAELSRREWEEVGEGEPGPLVLREPQLAEARAALQGAQATLAHAHLELERTRIRAPYPGRVRETLADLGQVVGPGTPLARVYATDAVEARLPVLTSELAFLELPGALAPVGAAGPPVMLSAELAGERRSWSGRIVRVAGEIDPHSRMATLVARVPDGSSTAAPSPGPRPPVGLFVEAAIAGRTLPRAVALPRAALREGDQVLVVDEEGRLRHRWVRVARRVGDTVVIQGGLEEGERVCTSPLEVVVEGMRVRVVEEEPRGAHATRRRFPAPSGRGRMKKAAHFDPFSFVLRAGRAPQVRFDRAPRSGPSAARLWAAGGGAPARW